MQVSPPAVKLQNTLMASPVQPWFGSIQYSPGRRKQVRYTAAGVEWGQLCPSCSWMPEFFFFFALAHQLSLQLWEWKSNSCVNKHHGCSIFKKKKMLLSWKNSIVIPEESRFSLWTSQKPAIKTGSLTVLCLIYVKNNSLHDYRSKVQSFVFKGCSHLGLPCICPAFIIISD